MHAYMNMNLLLSRQDTRSSSDVPTRPSPMPASSRSPRSSCCCWTVCGRCGVSSPWPWASPRRCCWGWRPRPTRLTTAPSCVTAIRRGQSYNSRQFHLYIRGVSNPPPSLSPLRCALGVKKNTHCLFQALLRPGERDCYSNPLYEPTELAIWPSVHPQSLQLWRGELWWFLSADAHSLALNAGMSNVGSLYCKHVCCVIDFWKFLNSCWRYAKKTLLLIAFWTNDWRNQILNSTIVLYVICRAVWWYFYWYILSNYL